MTPTFISYGALAFAILSEVIGTTSLQQSQQFTRLGPSLLTAVCYGISFYLLSVALKSISVGIAYAIWSGIGIVLIAAIGWILFRQALDLAAIIGIGFIIVGVIIVNVFSHSVTH